MEEKNNNLAMNEKHKDRYIDPLTDFGFKKLFGEECNKDLLLDFLNELLHKEEGKIVSLSYIKNERAGFSKEDRKAVFDIFCENEAGEQFLVEMQKSKQQFFKDRILFYSTFPIISQAPIGGDWNYELKTVYTIAILNFELDKLDKNKNDKYRYDLTYSDIKDYKLTLPDMETNKYRYDVMLSDIETNEIFYDKLRFVYLEMPKFTKTVDELETGFDKWMYVLKNLTRLDNVPDKLREKVFEKFFEAAEIAKLTHNELIGYIDSTNTYRDWDNCMDTAKKEGKAEEKTAIQNSLSPPKILPNFPPSTIYFSIFTPENSYFPPTNTL